MTDTFLSYLALRQHEASPVGDLARDALADPRFVEVASLDELTEYLSAYGDPVVEAGAAAWLDWRRWSSRRRDAC